MTIFVDAGETGVIMEGVRYLRIEGVFYCGVKAARFCSMACTVRWGSRG